MKNAAFTALAALALAAASGCGAGSAGAASTAPPSSTIAGVVGGAVAAGVTVTLGGASAASATTSGTGAYAFDGLANGTYTVTPARAGFTFSPVSRVVELTGADVAGQDFAATAAVTTSTISGTVSGATAQGVTMTLSGAAAGTTTTAANGTYAFAGLVNGSYTVTPSKAGYTFAPASLAVTVSGADVGGRNFAATAVVTTSTISGTVSGATAQGVTMTLSGAASRTTTTAANGTYAFAGLADGSYTVTPSKAGYTFAPASLAVTVSGADVGGRSFTASAVPTYGISGTVSGATAAGVTMTLGGAASRTTTTASDGTYGFTGLASGSYTVTPYKVGYAFSPSSLAVTLSGADVTGRNFVASPSTSTAPTLEAGFPVCTTISNQHAASTTLTITTAGPRHLVLGTAWYAFDTDPYPLTITWVGGAPAGATPWTRQTWPNDGSIHWTSQLFTATTTGALSSQQVTITRPNATDYTDALTCIWAYAGAGGFAAATDHHSPMTDVSQNIYVPADVTVSATAASSILVGVLAAGEIDQSRVPSGHVTPRANTTVDRENVAPGSGQAAFHLTVPTTGAGAYTIGLTNTNRAYAVEAIEVLAQ